MRLKRTAPSCTNSQNRPSACNDHHRCWLVFSKLIQSCAGAVLLICSPAAPCAEYSADARQVQQQQDDEPRPDSSQDLLSAPDRALLDAASNRNLELCIFALDRGANPDIRDSSQEANPVLLLASRNGGVGIVRKLLAKGALPNAASRSGITALMQAARSSQTEIASALIAAGARLDLRDARRGYSALMHAAEQGNESVLNVIVEAGADVNQADTERGLTALMLAANRLTGFPMLLDLLAAGADINYRAMDGWTALMAAVAQKNNDAIEVLILNGAELLTQTNDKRNALSIAAESNALKAMQLLADSLRQQNDMQAINESLHIAARNGSVDIVEHLLSIGMNPDQYNDAGHTVLHSAVLSGKDEVVSTVLQSDTNPNATTKKDGHSALMLAANRGMLSTVRKLLNAGADVDLTAQDGWTATEAAEMVGATDIVEALRSYKTN